MEKFLPLHGEVRLFTPLLILGSLALLAAMYLTPILRRRRALSRYPLFGAEYGSRSAREDAYREKATAMYREAHSDPELRENIYRITTPDGEKLIIPTRYLDELRKLPDSVVDNTQPIMEAIEGHTTGASDLDRDQFIVTVVRSELTKNLPRINPALADEVRDACDRALPRSEGWKLVPVESTILNLVATISGRIFIGPDLCRRPEWIDASINYTVHLMLAVRALKRWPQWMRPMVAKFFCPEMNRVEKHRATARAFLKPVIEDRQRRMRGGEKVHEDDMLQWMMNKLESDPEGMKGGTRDFAFMQLGLTFAAIHTTTRALTETIFDLIAHPEVIPDLRKEIQTALDAHDGVMTTRALFEMRLLDSVMKESHRLSPTGIERFARLMKTDVTLSDGTFLPKGSTVEVAYGATVARDPTLFPDPDKYDPYRHYHLRTGATPLPPGFPSKTQPEQFQFVSVTEADLGFGYGRHACPGRFFAANEIKLVLARLILEYDVAMPEGKTGRYQPVGEGVNSIPCPGAMMRYRTRRT